MEWSDHGIVLTGRPHGEKTPLQRAGMAVLDTINVPITRVFNVLGDRVVLVAQRR